MKKTIAAAIIMSSLALAGCGGKGDDKLANRVEDNAEERADALDQRAEQLEDKADRVEETGENRADAIDAADVNADAMTTDKKQAIVDGQAPAVK